MHGVMWLPGVTSYDKNYFNNLLSKHVLGALKKCLREMFLLSTQSMYVMLRKYLNINNLLFCYILLND